jgi:hypothetical protein
MDNVISQNFTMMISTSSLLQIRNIFLNSDKNTPPLLHKHSLHHSGRLTIKMSALSRWDLLCFDFCSSNQRQQQCSVNHIHRQSLAVLDSM